MIIWLAGPVDELLVELLLAAALAGPVDELLVELLLAAALAGPVDELLVELLLAAALAGLDSNRPPAAQTPGVELIGLRIGSSPAVSRSPAVATSAGLKPPHCPVTNFGPIEPDAIRRAAERIRTSRVSRLNRTQPPWYGLGERT
jgi:hypothetical protein